MLTSQPPNKKHQNTDRKSPRVKAEQHVLGRVSFIYAEKHQVYAPGSECQAAQSHSLALWDAVAFRRLDRDPRARGSGGLEVGRKNEQKRISCGLSLTPSWCPGGLNRYVELYMWKSLTLTASEGIVGHWTLSCASYEFVWGSSLFQLTHDLPPLSGSPATCPA